MGNSQASHPDDARYTAAARNFASGELDALNSLFASLAAQSGSADSVSPSALNAHFRLSGLLADKLFDEITQRRQDHRLTFRDFVLAKSALEKASPAEIDEFLFSLVDLDGDGLVTRPDLDLDAVVSSILLSLFPDGGTDASAFTNAADLTDTAQGGKQVMGFQDFKNWCRLLPTLRKYLGNMLADPDSWRPGFQLPNLLTPKDLDPIMLVMKKEFVWLIAGALPSEQAEQWELLYHSSVNGQSFTTFLGCVGQRGATVLLVKDRQGCVYGGYASQPWEKHGDFYGDVKCFLFQLHPRASLYRSAGVNGNYQWCAANFSSESIPNGVGFGGKVNHFGLFVSESFDQGQSFACSTFNSPCLSEVSRILPEVIECWGLETVKEKETQHLKGTVLDRFKEDRHMLNMVGLANSSQG